MPADRLTSIVTEPAATGRRAQDDASTPLPRVCHPATGFPAGGGRRPAAPARPRWTSTALLLLLIAAAPPGRHAPLAQTATTGVLRGLVTDGSGEGIPGVVITIKRSESGSTARDVVTDAEGRYVASALAPARDYLVTVSYPGFAPMEAGPLDLGAGHTITVDLALQPASELTETVRVEALFDLGSSTPNRAPDLYTVSPSFNQVFRVGNFNSARYESWELTLEKRLHRNWQMQTSYTWSESFGQAETFLSTLGDDPETIDDEEGYLDYDQRHVLKFSAVTRLPHEILLGSVVQWESGTPFSVIRVMSDLDSTGNGSFRRFYPTGSRNDQRNETFWKIDGRVEKTFIMGRVNGAAYLIAENLLDKDRLTIYSNDVQPVGGRLDGVRAFGRRFEIGCSFTF